MKVILLKDVKGTGKKDQVLEVSDGFARNFLLPRKVAIEATSDAVNAIERAKGAAKHREDVKQSEAEALSRSLKGKVVVVKVRAGEGGKLYGSITSQEIADAIKTQLGVEIDKRKVELTEPVKSLGQTTVNLKLYAGVSARIIANIVAAEYPQKTRRGGDSPWNRAIQTVSLRIRSTRRSRCWAACSAPQGP